jgi:hypothetical protein
VIFAVSFLSQLATGKPTAPQTEQARQVCGNPLKPNPGLTPISSHAVLERSACAPFIKERRMKCINATSLRRKSGQMGHPARLSHEAPDAWKAVRGKGTLQVPRLPPDFLSGLVASVNLMRLSSKKAAYVVVLESSVVGNPEFARDDKGEGGCSP